MKKTILLLGLALMLVLLGCPSTPKIDRLDPSTQTDLSGEWNDTDRRLAAESLIEQCLGAPWQRTFTSVRGKLPVLIVGRFRNDSDEHINTSILSDRLEIAITNSGKASFVASGDLRDEIRGERLDQQQGYTDDATIARIGREIGADYMMTGSIKTEVDRYGRVATRNYIITARLTDITTNNQVWMGQYEIKKEIKSPSARP